MKPRIRRFGFDLQTAHVVLHLAQEPLGCSPPLGRPDNSLQRTSYTCALALGFPCSVRIPARHSDVEWAPVGLTSTARHSVMCFETGSSIVFAVRSAKWCCLPSSEAVRLRRSVVICVC